MKNKILALALSLSFIATGVSTSMASDTAIKNETKMEASMNEEMKYIFDVVEVGENEVKVYYAGEVTKDAFVMEASRDGKEFSIEKSKLPADIKSRDQIEVNSIKKFDDLKAEDIKKENIKLYNKYEAPKNMDTKDVPKDATVKEFLVESINKDSVNPTAVLSEADNPESKYTIGLDKLQDENPMEGYMYKIYWDGVTLESYPAQFGQIFRVEPVLLSTHEADKDDAENQSEKREFEVTEVHESGVTLAETSNKDNLYSISFDDLKDRKPAVGDRYMITWSGNSTRSYPAQFIGITNVDKWMKKDVKEVSVNKEELQKAIDEADKTTTVNGSFTEESVKAFEEAKAHAKDVNANAKASQDEVDAATKKLNDTLKGLTIEIDKNMDESKIYEIIEINGEGKDKTVILKEKDSELTYMLSYEKLNDKDAKVGDRYEIKTNGIILPSNPAQFGEVLDVAKIEYQKESTGKEDTKEENNKKEEEKKESSKKEEVKKEEAKAKNTVGFGNPKTGIAPVAPVVGVLGLAAVLLRKKK